METSGSRYFPALGFFGGSEGLLLRVPIGERVSGVRLGLSSSEPTYLNLQGVRLIGDHGEDLGSRLTGVRELASSVHASAPNSNLLQFSGHHSALEESPVWSAEWEENNEVAVLEIANRRDTYARRSRNICVEIRTGSDEWVKCYQHGAEVSYLAAALSVGELLARRNLHFGGKSRRALMRLVAQALEAMTREESARRDWISLVSLLPIWQDAELEEDDLCVAAAFLIAEFDRRNDFAFTYLSAVLQTPKTIERLAAKVNWLCQREGGPRYFFTRHGMQREGRLSAERHKYVTALLNTCKILDELEKEPVLAYGTLLGAVREKAFIPHDDDVDVLCRVNATGFASAREAMVELAKVFRHRGYRVEFVGPASLNLHIIDPQSGAIVDLFPHWTVGEQTFLHMEKMAVRSIPASILRERGKIEFHGETFHIPGKTEAFLRQRYGDDWAEPNPYFEWPWKMQREE